jgi:hypothetical protein
MSTSTPVTADTNATAAQLQAAAAQERAAAQAAAQNHTQGCIRQGVLPGGAR